MMCSIYIQANVDIEYIIVDIPVRCVDSHLHVQNNKNNKTEFYFIFQYGQIFNGSDMGRMAMVWSSARALYARPMASE
jgi:hypothetical protein